ncbi:flagellar biosynthetic protein FliR [Stratiformator vulcanicus]|uniref:Flagellar biosynthesis protein FliR n=1 Tax=Stratiformator vulcanicus TaxID=2527980 RepID=A0A517R583_9PLAN|nr:flagellar biosynthetic protein FliR [Stratiformator vulcanicus]QDT39044.1 flagellar biosynthesis protein FliR [Stratiformator vulcanicus]
MPGFLNDIANQVLADGGAAVVLDWAMGRVFVFILILIRLSGLMLIGPVFGVALVPANVRILLALSLALVITPNVVGRASVGFDRLDTNGDGVLTAEEIPESIDGRGRRLLAASPNGITRAAFVRGPALPDSILEFGVIIAGEIAIGLALGLGTLIILSGLQFAGELIDQQTGIAIGQIFNPGFEDMDGSITSQFLYLLATTLFLVATPLNVHLKILETMIDTFQVMPPGTATLGTPAVDLLSGLVHNSLVLGIQVAAPVLAIMSVVALSMGFLGHTVPQINVLVIGFPIRVLAALLVLTISLGGIGETIINALDQTAGAMHIMLVGLER